MTKRTRSDSPTKFCTLDNCDHPLRARGLCATHYNRLVVGESKRHPKTAVPCAACGTVVLRRQDRLELCRPTCSVSCRAVVQWGERLAQQSTYDWRADAVQRAKEYGAKIVDRFDREEIFERDGWQCQCCEIRCSSPDPYSLTAATIDHIRPLSQGGDHSRTNVQTLCLSCNARKRDLASAA